MKKRFAGIGAVTALLAGAGVAAAGSTPPNVQSVSASFDLKLIAGPSGHQCTGPGPQKDTYETFTATWSGPQVDTSSGGHPRGLNGTVTETTTTTIDLTTGVGIAKGTTQLVGTKGALVYKGSFVVNVQLMSNGTSVARGALDVPFYRSNSPSGGSLIGNREETIASLTASSPLEVKGTFGTSSPSVPDLSAEWDGAQCT